MHRTSGFTLIEVIIVVAIIALLAALAFPAYQDAIIRAQVAEASSLFGAPKVAVADYYHAKGVAPDTNLEAVLPPPLQIKGKYVSRLDVTAGGVLTATFGAAAHHALQARTLMLRPSFTGGSARWTCDGGDLDPRWLPSGCR